MDILHAVLVAEVFALHQGEAWLFMIQHTLPFCTETAVQATLTRCASCAMMEMLRGNEGLHVADARVSIHACSI